MRRIVHTVNTDFSGVEGYVKEYHGSGVAQALLDAQLGQREVIEAAAHRVRWCPTGRGLSIASPEGLLVYISADERIVDPLELEVEVTPQAVNDCASKGEWVNAIVMAIRLGHSERQLLLSVLTQVPTDTIEFVCNHIPPKYAVDFLQTLSESLRSFLQIELLFMWITAMLRFHTESLLKNPAAVPVMHLFLKSLSSRIEEIRQLSRSNLDMMRFLCDQPDLEETKTAEND